MQSSTCPQNMDLKYQVRSDVACLNCRVLAADEAEPARRPQLSVAAAGALGAGLGPAAGQLLALAAASYLAGQTFGAGTATFPAALAVGMAGITAAFNNLELSNSARAQQIALAVYLMTISTIVVFPAPLPPAPIL